MRSSLTSFMTRLVFCSLFSMATCLSGCADPLNAEILELQQRFMINVPPQGEVSISSVRADLESGELAADSEVVIRARISAGDVPPWAEGQAQFIVTDATGHDGDEDHDPHECPFCKRNIMDSMAQVRLSGKDGKTIAIDTRKLLGVKDHSLLVIRARVIPENSEMLSLDARQICVVSR